jgi:hypothetical protein
MDVMGETDGYVMGDVDGDVIGRRRRGHGPMVHLPARPHWRQGQAAPGIHLPREGREILPLTPNVTNGQFDTTNIGAVITFTGRPQRPFQGQRLVGFVTRAADAVAGLPAGFVMSRGVFVGTQPQQLALGEFNVEIFGPTAFDLMFDMTPAQPGIDVTMDVRLTIAPTGTQKVQVAVVIMGHSLGN